MAETTIRQLIADRVLELGDGYRTKRAEHGTPGYRIIRVADVREGAVFLDGDDFVSVDYEPQMGGKIARAGDVLLTTKGTVGRVAVMPATAELAVYSPQLCYFRVHEDTVVSPAFLRYWLQSGEFTGQSSFLQGNTDMAPYISLSDLRSATITLPVLDEQRAIAEVLGALDDKIAANTKLAAVANSLVNAHFDKALSGSHDLRTLGELERMDVLEIGDGYRTKRDELAGDGYRIIRAGDLGSGSVGFGADAVSMAFEAKIGSKAARARDIVLTTKGTVGRVGVIPERFPKAVYSPQLCYFRVTDESVLNWGFMVGWFKSRDLQSQAELRMGQSDMAPYINLADIRSMQVPHLSLETSRRVGGLIEAFVQRVSSAHEECRALAATRDALLPALMSGRLSVRDAERIVEGSAQGGARG